MNKRQIIEKFCTEFSRTNYKNTFRAKLLPYTALAASLDLKLWHDIRGFEFKTRGVGGRLIAKVSL